MLTYVKSNFNQNFDNMNIKEEFYKLSNKHRTDGQKYKNDNNFQDDLLNKSELAEINPFKNTLIIKFFKFSDIFKQFKPVYLK